MSELDAIEGAMLDALATIRKHWDALLPADPGSIRPSRSAPKRLYTLPDDSDRADDIPPVDARVSLRHEVTLALNGWARVVVEDREVKPWKRCDHGVTVTLSWPKVGPTLTRCAADIGWSVNGDGCVQSGLHPIEGTDTLGLIEFLERHAQWFAGHEAARDAVDELATWAGKVRAVAEPRKRDWLTLGDCPFVVEDWFCAGQVRWHHDEERLPSCTDCGQEAVVDWWMEVLGVVPTVTHEGLVDFIRNEFGKVIGRATLRKWLQRGVIESCGMDAEGRTLFDKGAVAYALQRREMMDA